MQWEPEAGDEILRPRPLRLLTSPVRERRFVYSRYDQLLERLADPTRYHVVPLRELAAEDDSGRVVVVLRHDIDLRLDAALVLAQLEAARGLRSTYFVLHTAPYYGSDGGDRPTHDERVLPRLRALQDLGHEVGWHNDLLTLQVVHGVDPVGYLRGELAWLRGAGVEVVGTAAHGSYWCHALGYSNSYLFEEVGLVPGFPNRDEVAVDGRRVALARARLADFGLEYEASLLDHDVFCSDARFDAGRRWHPDFLELEDLEPGHKVIVLIHPCLWHSGVGSKAARIVGGAAYRAARRALGRAPVTTG